LEFAHDPDYGRAGNSPQGCFTDRGVASISVRKTRPVHKLPVCSG
jgi:hypothetical protein